MSQGGGASAQNADLDTDDDAAFLEAAGFDAAAVAQALAFTGGDVEQAMELLLSGELREGMAKGFSSAPPSAASSADAEGDRGESSTKVRRVRWCVSRARPQT